MNKDDNIDSKPQLEVQYNFTPFWFKLENVRNVAYERLSFYFSPEQGTWANQVGAIGLQWITLCIRMTPSGIFWLRMSPSGLYEATTGYSPWHPFAWKWRAFGGDLPGDKSGHLFQNIARMQGISAVQKKNTHQAALHWGIARRNAFLFISCHFQIMWIEKRSWLLDLVKMTVFSPASWKRIIWDEWRSLKIVLVINTGCSQQWECPIHQIEKYDI